MEGRVFYYESKFIYLFFFIIYLGGGGDATVSDFFLQRIQT